MINVARVITRTAFGLSAAGATIQTALGREANRFGLLDMSMPTLTAALATSAKPGRTRDAATLALLASTAGDMSGTIPFKIGWFAIAHAAYVAAFHPTAKRRRWWPVVPIIVAAGVWASARAAHLRPACIIYACLVAAMAVTASGHSRLAGISALAFAASDMLIAYGLFRAGKQPAWAHALTVGLYLAAQAGLATAVVREGEPE